MVEGHGEGTARAGVQPAGAGQIHLVAGQEGDDRRGVALGDHAGPAVAEELLRPGVVAGSPVRVHRREGQVVGLVPLGCTPQACLVGWNVRREGGQHLAEDGDEAQPVSADQRRPGGGRAAR